MSRSYHDSYRKLDKDRFNVNTGGAREGRSVRAGEVGFALQYAYSRSGCFGLRGDRRMDRPTNRWTSGRSKVGIVTWRAIFVKFLASLNITLFMYACDELQEVKKVG